LEAVLHTVRKLLNPWLTRGDPPLIVLAGSSQGGTVALALALDLMAEGHRPSLVLLYHSTIMERHLQKALPMSRLRIHLQLATSDTIYSPEAVETQAQRLGQAGHYVSVARDTQNTWHGGEVELKPSLDILRSFLMQQSDRVSAKVT
jgi:acetyl esterase/lipase